MKRFFRSRSGLAGFVLLAIFLLLALFGPLVVPFPGAERHWHDLSWWQDSPAAVPPSWMNGPWNGYSLPGTELLRSGPPRELTNGDGGRLLSWSFPLAIGRPGPPRDLVLRFAGNGKVFLLASLVHADGSTEEVLRQVQEVAKGQMGRIPLHVREAASLELEEYLAPGQARPSVGPSLLLVGKSSGLLGTDVEKRDIWTGVVLGIRWALVLGAVVSFLTVLTGLLLGTIAACYGGFLDSVINRVYEFFSLMPLLPFLMALSVAYHPSLWSFMALALLFFWTRSFKTVYARALQIKEEGHIEAARMMGAGRWWRVTRHVLPALLPYGFAVMALSVPGIILYEASVSLLGLGDSSTITWGQMLHDALVQGAVINRLWWWILPPGLSIALMGLTFALLGRGFDRVLNPRSR